MRFEITRLIKHFFTRYSGISTVILFVFFIGTGQAQVSIEDLTPAETAWLQSHDQLRVQLAEDWPPFNYTENDKPKGYVNDYLFLLANKLGLEVDFVRGFSWEKYVEMLDQGEIDCITNMTITPERRKRFLFTEESAIDVFNGLLTSKSNIGESDLEKLKGATVAVVKGYAQEELLKLYYPDINLLLTENLLDAIRQVMAGKADAAIGAHAVFNHYISRHLLDEVVSIPLTGNNIFPTAPHYLAVNQDNTILLGLLDKARSSLSKTEIDHLNRKWNLTYEAEQFKLSEEEQEYLAQKDKLNICVDPDWMPMESIRRGQHTGMAADYLQLLASKLGTKTNLVITNSWKQTLMFAQERKCDLVSLAMSTPERRQYLDFSAPYVTTPLVLATKTSAPYIADLGALKNKRIGVRNDYAFGLLIKKKYPQIRIVDVPSLEKGLQMVHQGELYGFIGSLPTIVYAVQQNYPSSLKIAGNTGEKLELRMGLRNDEPLLVSAMNKAIDSIKTEEHQEIFNRWIAVQYEEGTDYTLVFRILIGAAILVVLLLYRQVTLNRFNRELQKSNKEILEKSELLERTQQQLLLTQHAVDSCSFPIFWLHHDLITGFSRVVHTNRAAEVCLGYTKQELTTIEPKAIAENLNFMDKEVHKNGGEQEQGVKSSQKAVFRRKDGTTFPVELHISSFTYENEHYRFIFFNDMTQQHEMEAKLHRSMKMEAVGLMAGGVAHDLNNILSGIVAYPDLLLHKLNEDDPMRPQLVAIKKSGEQAAQVVDDLLTVARGVAAVQQTAHLNTLIMAYFDSPEFERLQDHYPRVRCLMDLASDLKNINCSPLHIKKSIMNLVTNGYEAIPQGGTIQVSTFNQSISENHPQYNSLKSGDYVVFAVKDSGSGIPESAIPHIFEPFYTKKQMGRSGTGLGLSIVWNTAYDHGGTVIVENTNGGARFLLYLPATENALSVTNEVKMEERLYGNNEKILVVDDVPQQLDIASRMLQTLGYRVNTVSSGEEAIETIKRESFDLVLLDMIMSPGIGGKETYGAIRKISPGQKGVIASGFSKDKDVKATLAMGAGDFVRKPYSLYRLAVAIKNVLQEPVEEKSPKLNISRKPT